MLKRTTIKLNVLIFFLLFSIFCLGQNVSLDSTFGINGSATIDLDGELVAVKLLDDGGFCCVGWTYNENSTINTRVFIAKLDMYGQPLSTFGTNGILIDSIYERDIPYNVIVQDDGKIIVAGTGVVNTNVGQQINYNGFVARYNQDGGVDSTFGINGILKLDNDDNLCVYDICKWSSNSYIVAHTINNTFSILKINQNGAVDSNFGTNGYVLDEFDDQFAFRDMIVLSDKNVIVTGSDFSEPQNSKTAIYKLDTTGNLMTDFGVNGIITINIDNQIEIFPEAIEYPTKVIEDDFGRLLILGIFQLQFTFIIRVLGNGSIDSSFGDEGIFNLQTGLFENSFHIFNNGSILLGTTVYQSALSDYDYKIVKIDSIGFIDMNFNSVGDFIFIRPLSDDYLKSILIAEHENYLFLCGTKVGMGASNAEIIKLNINHNNYFENLDSDQEIIVFPNPFVSTFKIEVNEGETVKLVIFNMEGVCVYHEILLANEKNINVNLPKGEYIFNISCSKISRSFKMIKIN